MSHCSKNPIFTLDNITLGYSKNDIIVKDLTMEINEGEFVSIIGPNGSGKSTVLRSLAKILLPKQGAIKYRNKFINVKLKDILFYFIAKNYKIPVKQVYQKDLTNLQESTNLQDSTILKNYYLAKAYQKAQQKGFVVGDVYITKNNFEENKILDQVVRFAKLNQYLFNQKIYFDSNIVNKDLLTNQNEYNNNKENWKAILTTYAALKYKPNQNQLIYDPDYDRNKTINKINKWLKSKKIEIDQDYIMAENNEFLDDDFLKNSNIIDKLKKLLSWKKFLKVSDSIPLYSFEKFYFSSKEYSKHVAFVPQITNFPSEVTVEEFVKMGRYPHNKPLSFFDSNQDKKIIEESLEHVNLLDLKDKYLDNLSGGQKQRAILALALAQDTDTILLDEPTNHLDIKHQLEIIHLLHDLNHKLKKTIILVIHDINHGMKFSDKIAIMNHGNIIKYGPTNTIVDKKIIKDVFGVDAKVELSQEKKIISDYWIQDLNPLQDYHQEKDKCCKSKKP